MPADEISHLTCVKALGEALLSDFQPVTFFQSASVSLYIISPI